jgi:hypothetical protein
MRHVLVLNLDRQGVAPLAGRVDGDTNLLLGRLVTVRADGDVHTGPPERLVRPGDRHQPTQLVDLPVPDAVDLADGEVEAGELLVLRHGRHLVPHVAPV